MKLSSRAIALALLFIGFAQVVYAQRQDRSSVYRGEDFEIYRNAIFVKDYEMQRVAVNAMSYYPQGYPVLIDILRTNASSTQAYLAAVTLTNFNKLPTYEKDLKKALEGIDKLAQATPDTTERIWSVRRVVVRNLFLFSPKTYAKEMIENLQRHLNKSGRDISFGDGWAEDLTLLASVVEKKKLYGFVPILIDNMEGFFSDTKERAHKLLVLITGEDYPFKMNSAESRREAMEKYRELYYTKLKPQMAK